MLKNYMIQAPSLSIPQEKSLINHNYKIIGFL